MDSMTLWEITDIIEYIPYIDKNLWESQRLCAYVMAQVNSREKLAFDDICTFPWEKDYNAQPTEIGNNDISRLKDKAQMIKQQLSIESIMREQ